MTLILHIIKKDLLRVQWLFATQVLLTMAVTLMRGTRFQRPVIIEDLRLNDMGYSDVFAFALGLLTSVIVSAIVHDDPVPGTSAFWLTRPISRRQIFAAKAAGLLLTIVAPGLLLESLVLLRWGVASIDVAHAVAEQLLICAAALVPLFAAAAVTKNFGRMMLLLGGTLVAILLANEKLRRPIDWVFSPNLLSAVYVEPPKSNLSLIGLSLWLFTLLAFGSLTWWYYRTRKGAIVMPVMGVSFAALLFALPVLETMASVPAEETVAASWAASEGTQARALLNEATQRMEDHYVPLPDRSMKPFLAVYAPVILDGLPDSDTAAPTIERAQLEIDGQTLLTDYLDNTAVGVTPGRWRPSLTWRGNAWPFSGSVYGYGDLEMWPALMILSKSQGEQYAGRPAHYTATVRFDVRHQELLDTRPLEPGIVRVDRSSRVEILSTKDRDGLCEVETRATTLDFRLELRAAPARGGFRFHRRDGQPLRAARTRGRSDQSYSWPLPVSPIGALSALRVATATLLLVPLDYDVSHPAASAPVACADVRWSAIRTTEAGVVRRQLDIPDFVLPLASQR